MPDFVPMAAMIMGGFFAGAFLMWFTHRAPPIPDDRASSMAIAIRRLTHDIRGALSPAMLVAERLENHADPGIRDAGAVVTRTLERVAQLCRETSASIKHQQTME